MKATRRKFMAMLGLGAAGSPVAASAAIQKEMFALTNVAVGSAGSSISGGVPMDVNSYDKAIISASDYVRIFGIPEHVAANMWASANWIERIDPDIASKRSWSLSFKFLEQKRRNFERSVERMKISGPYVRGRAAFKATTGWDWPW